MLHFVVSVAESVGVCMQKQSQVRIPVNVDRYQHPIADYDNLTLGAPDFNNRRLQVLLLCPPARLFLLLFFPSCRGLYAIATWRNLGTYSHRALFQSPLTPQFLAELQRKLN
jgi:hypothetical protein